MSKESKMYRVNIKAMVPGDSKSIYRANGLYQDFKDYSIKEIKEVVEKFFREKSPLEFDTVTVGVRHMPTHFVIKSK